MNWNTIKPGILTVWTYKAFAPVCFIEGDEAVGMDITFLKKFANKLAADHGITKVEFSSQGEFDGIWQKPGEERCDIAAAGISPWKWRKDESPGVVWTEDYFHVQRSLLIRQEDEHQFHTMADFANKTIAVTLGSSADKDTRARKPESTKIVPINNQKLTVKDLLEYRIDAIAEGDVSNSYLARGERLVLTDVHELDPKNPEAFSFPVRRASGIVDALNAWIAVTPKEEYLKFDA